MPYIVPRLSLPAMTMVLPPSALSMVVMRNISRLPSRLFPSIFLFLTSCLTNGLLSIDPMMIFVCAVASPLMVPFCPVTRRKSSVRFSAAMSTPLWSSELTAISTGLPSVANGMHAPAGSKVTNWSAACAPMGSSMSRLIHILVILFFFIVDVFGLLNVYLLAFLSGNMPHGQNYKRLAESFFPHISISFFFVTCFLFFVFLT